MDKKKKDYLLFSLAFQFLVCLLLFGGIWGLKKADSDIYLLLKNDFYSQLGSDFNVINKAAVTSGDDIDENEKITYENIPETKEHTDKEAEKSENNELTVEIKGKSEEDYSVESIGEIPENVSVNSYVLNQKMVVPLQGKITSEFGVRTHPISNSLKFHAGIDIAADSGTPIYAAFSGKVIVADYDEWNGNYMKIQHEGNIMTVYCHCESLTFKSGDYVEAGEIIGYVGSTGSSTGPHLHFELRVNNVSYDPKSALDNGVNAV